MKKETLFFIVFSVLALSTKAGFTIKGKSLISNSAMVEYRFHLNAKFSQRQKKIIEISTKIFENQYLEQKKMKYHTLLQRENVIFSAGFKDETLTFKMRALNHEIVDQIKMFQALFFKPNFSISSLGVYKSLLLQNKIQEKDNTYSRLRKRLFRFLEVYIPLRDLEYKEVELGVSDISAQELEEAYVYLKTNSQVEVTYVSHENLKEKVEKEINVFGKVFSENTGFDYGDAAINEKLSLSIPKKKSAPFFSCNCLWVQRTPHAFQNVLFQYMDTKFYKIYTSSYLQKQSHAYKLESLSNAFKCYENLTSSYQTHRSFNYLFNRAVNRFAQLTQAEKKYHINATRLLDYSHQFFENKEIQQRDKAIRFTTIKAEIK